MKTNKNNKIAKKNTSSVKKEKNIIKKQNKKEKKNVINKKEKNKQEKSNVKEFNIYEEYKQENDVENGCKKDEKSKKTKINKIKAIIIGIIAIVLIIYAVLAVFRLLKNPSSTMIVKNGNLSKEETINGYIIRDESIIDKNETSKQIIKIKQDGERVAKGDSIYRYYSSDGAQLEEKIAQLDEDIQKVLEENDTTFSSDKKLLETQITNELNNVYKDNEMQTIQEYKKNIEKYILKKAKIVGNLSPSGSYLRKLINQRTDYENQLNDVSEYVSAPSSGIVSYRVDGLENVLVTTNVANLNKNFLENLKLNTGEIIASSENTGKIINNYSCYIIFNSNSEESKSAKLNDKIKIKVQNLKEQTAVIKNIIEETDGSRTISIEIEKNIEQMISYRKVSIDVVWWEANGFRIPNTAIKEINNIHYVVRNRNGYLDNMPIKILKETDEYSIVTAYSRSELVELGLSSDEISNLKTITLYDRIQINPQ